jgi:hypothetical protein
MNPRYIYSISIVIGIILNFILQTSFYYSIDGASDLEKLITTVIYSSIFFAIKISLFSLTYLLLNKDFIHNSKKYEIIFTAMSPFLFFIFYYFIIIVFKIKSLQNDINLSFINYYPHSLIQIFSSLILSLATTLYINKKINKHLKSIKH